MSCMAWLVTPNGELGLYTDDLQLGLANYLYASLSTCNSCAVSLIRRCLLHQLASVWDMVTLGAQSACTLSLVGHNIISCMLHDDFFSVWVRVKPPTHWRYSHHRRPLLKKVCWAWWERDQFTGFYGPSTDSTIYVCLHPILIAPNQHSPGSTPRSHHASWAPTVSLPCPIRSLCVTTMVSRPPFLNCAPGTLIVLFNNSDNAPTVLASTIEIPCCIASTF